MFPLDSPQPVVADFVDARQPPRPGARQWAATLFLLDHRDGAGKGYCRDWIAID